MWSGELTPVSHAALNNDSHFRWGSVQVSVTKTVLLKVFLGSVECKHAGSAVCCLGFIHIFPV